jgi:hypothetical protein
MRPTIGYLVADELARRGYSDAGLEFAAALNWCETRANMTTDYAVEDAPDSERHAIALECVDAYLAKYPRNLTKR